MYLFPKPRIDYGIVLAWVGFAFVDGFTEIYAIVQQPVEIALVNQVALLVAESIAAQFTGQNGLVLAQHDPVAPSKILVEFEKKHKTPSIRSGWVETALVSAAQVRQIAELPSRETLIAQIAAGVQAPVAGFAILLQELMRRLVATLDEVAKQRAGADAA